MAKLIKRNKVPIKEKFKQAVKFKQDKLSLNKEEESEESIKKLLSSNLAPIINTFYVDNPVI